MGRKKRFTIGLGFLFDYLYENYSSGIFHHVQQACRGYGMDFIGFEGGNSSIETFGQYHQQKNDVINLINPATIDGMILLAELVNNTMTAAENKKLGRRLEALPVVSIGRFRRARSSILIDNTKSLGELVRHLVERHERRRIAFIKGPASSLDGRQRLAAYQAALRQSGLPVVDKLIVSGDFYSRGADAVQVLLDERRADCDAIVCANDSMAVFALKELQRRGIRVPEEIAIVGFDDIEECVQITPRLTTVRQSFQDIAWESVRVMRAILSGEKVPSAVTLPTAAVIRESCGCSVAERVEQMLTLEGRARRKSPSGAGRRKEPSTAGGPDLSAAVEEAAALLERSGDEPGRRLFLRHMQGVLARLFEARVDSGRIFEFAADVFSAARGRRKITAPAEATASLWRETLLRIKLFEREFGDTRPGQIRTKEAVHFDVNDDFTGRISLEQLKDTMLAQLPKVRCRGFSVCLYSDPDRATATWLMRYDGAARHGTPPGREPFPAFHLWPGGTAAAGGSEYMVAALYFKEERLGFVLFDITGLSIKPEYDTLATQISGAIKSAMLTKAVTEYATQLEQKVRERTAQVERAGREKTDFFVKIVHETKTPLTLITNYLDGYIKKHGRTEELGVIQGNFEKLKKNMLDFLDAEKIERGKLVYRHDQAADVSAILRDALVLFQASAVCKDIAIRADLAPAAFAAVDPEAWERVVYNLLDNAVRYAPPGGVIDVRLRAEEERIVLSVEDRGCGLSEKAKSRVGDPYFQADGEGPPSPGIGMGLHIVKTIIASIGGDLAVESRVGAGTIVTCRLRRCPPPKKQARRAAVKPSPPRPFEVGDPVRAEDRSNVLFVEDNIELLAYLRENTRPLFNVYCARSGGEALEKLKRIPKPHVIVSDIMMGGLDGYRFYEELLRGEKYRDVPFIFLTALDSPWERRQALKRGAVDFISKPFSLDELIAKIDSLIRVQEALKERSLLLLGRQLYHLLENRDADRGPQRAADRDDVAQKLFYEYNISRKEIEVVSLLKHGFEHKEIAAKLGKSVNTVRTYIARVYKKCRVNNLVELLNKLKVI